MSAEDNSSAEPADIGEALVAALGFEPAEGRKLGRKSGGPGVDDLMATEEPADAGAMLDGAFAIVTPDQPASAKPDAATGPSDSNGSNGSAARTDGPATGGAAGGAATGNTVSGAAPSSGSVGTGTASGNRNRSGSRKSKKRRNRNNNSRAGISGQANSGQANAAKPADPSGAPAKAAAATPDSPPLDDIKFAAKPSVSTGPASGGAPGEAPTNDRSAPAAADPKKTNDRAQPNGGNTIAGNSNGGGTGAPAATAQSIEEAAAVTGELKDLIDLPGDSSAASQPPPPNAADAIAVDPAAAAGGPATTDSLAATATATTTSVASAAAAATAVPMSPPTMPATGTPVTGASPAAGVQAETSNAATAKIDTRAEAVPEQVVAKKQALELRGDESLQPAPSVQRELTKPGPGFDLASLQNIFRRKRRVQARKVRRVIRHIDPWSVLTFSVLFHLCVFAALLLASVLVWNAAEAAGTIENLEAFILDLGDYETFEIKGDVVFRAAVAIAGILTLASSVLLVLLTVVFNLISDLVGGIRLTVIEEETIRVRRKKQAS